MAIFHLLFKFLYHFQIVLFKVDFFYFFWGRVFKSSCCMIPGIWCCHVALQIVGGILALVTAQLLLQKQPGESLHWSKLCCVILSGSPQGRRKNCSLVLWVCGLSAGAGTPSIFHDAIFTPYSRSAKPLSSTLQDSIKTFYHHLEWRLCFKGLI